MLKSYNTFPIARSGFLRAFLLRRFINCSSCGVELQSTNADAPGYYIKRKSAPKKTLQQDLEAAKYLLFGQDIQRAREDSESSSDLVSASDLRKNRAPLICKRCVDVISHNKYDIRNFSKVPPTDVLQNIPKNSNIVHIIPLPEFPLNLDVQLLRSKNYVSSLVLTKADQLVTEKYTLQKCFPLFFKEFMKYHLNISTNKTLLVSALKNWNVSTLYANLSNRSYLFGSANAGKSTLINALIRAYMGYKIRFDKRGTPIPENEVPQEINDMNEYMKLQGAGVSHIPNMTRNLQAYKINEKVLFDLPGYSVDSKTRYLEELVLPEWLKRIRKTELFDRKKLKKKTYVSLNGTENGACYTIGGIFYLVPPPGSINQIVKFIPGEQLTFRNIDKALDVFQKCTSPDSKHPLKKYCGIKPKLCNKREFVRHIIPPFHGSIEVVVKDIGYITLRTTGKYEYRGLHEIWLPKGMDVCVREPLEKLAIEGYRKSIDSKGQEPCCPRDRPIISSTYPMAHDESHPLERMKEMYLERTSNDLLARRYTKEDPEALLRSSGHELRNLYWYYNWQFPTQVPVA